MTSALAPARRRFGAVRMDFRILGPLEVLDDGQAVPIGGTKQRALLALLLLHRNETLTTDRLIDELWGGRPEPTAVKALQVCVSRLRRALAGEAELPASQVKLDDGVLRWFVDVAAARKLNKALDENGPLVT